MKIVFLDIDGVLTYDGYENRETAHIDENKVELLAEIIKETDSKIVLISSWRGQFRNGLYVHPKIYYIMVKILQKHGLSINDIVPYINVEITDKREVSLLTLDDLSKIEINPETGRAAEVHQWLCSHPEVKRFVILDDEDNAWDYYGYERYWIQTNYYDKNGGLSKEHVNRAIAILLNGDDKKSQ
ncbi:HAD domain-containing protein [Hungatella hathewayi]|uniref:HAD domain-containing protein n=1 Tax=Hungatella hathewayi TaxID=154046 RepID=UPI003561640A